jgi:protein-tyrosine phosphatase
VAHAILTLFLGIVLCAIAWIQKGWFYALGWLGFDFLILGFAQLRRYHILFMKSADGTLPWVSWLIFLPLHLYSLAVLNVARALSREPARNKVCDDLWVGSRPGAGDVCDCPNVIDLTAEFQEPKQFRERPGYFSFPILDAGAPTANALVRALERCPRKPGPIFIHCAQGHGRTGIFAAAWLLANKRASTAEEAVEMLTKARPGIRLNSAQLRSLLEFEKKVHGG